MLAITGNGSWLDVGLDVLALVTFGIGRAFAKTAEGGYEAATAAARSPVARMLGKAGQGLARADVTEEAEKITGMSWKEAQTIVTDAKKGLSLPNWGEAALKGQNPVQVWNDFTTSLKTMGGWKSVFPAIGDAGMLSKENQFLRVISKFPNIENLPSVVRWTTIARV